MPRRTVSLIIFALSVLVWTGFMLRSDPPWPLPIALIALLGAMTVRMAYTTGVEAGMRWALDRVREEQDAR